MYLLPLAVLGVLASVVFAAPTTHQHVIHEKRNHLPSGWDYHSAVNKRSVLPVRIGLTQSNLDRAHDMLMSVSDPESENYGNHWTPKQVAEFFAPSGTTVDTVKEWLTSSGIHPDSISHSPNGWLEFSATIAEVEDLLKTKYHKYMHDGGKPHIACEEYSIPANIQEHVDFITPTVHFDPKVKRSPRKAKRSLNPALPISGPSIGKTLAANATQLANKLNGLTTCNAAIVPACLRALYNIPLGTKNLSSYGIIEYAPETYLQTDLDEFQATPLTNSGGIPVGTAPTIEGIDGGYLLPLTSASLDYQAEPDLDLEYAMDLVYPQQVTLFQVGDNGTNSEDISFNNFLDGIDKSYCTYSGGDDKTIDEQFPDPGGYKGKEQCGVWKPSSVISTSYGYNEHDLTPKYEQRQCNEYMKLGLQGVSFLYSSGDYGVAGNGGQCIAANGSYNDGTSGKFNPSFPGGCPYVTSVGATQIPTGGSVTTPETACESVIYSGGGFSNVFAMPSYQSTAVKSYFKNYKPTYTSAQYNNTQKTRAFPDVSANGANYVVAVDGAFTLLYGTSASAPVLGAIMTLINNERVAIGKKPLGFLNPTFYKYPTMFNDITSGGNQGCGTAGFTAVPGWDPVTGLGTPDYNKMLAKLLIL